MAALLTGVAALLTGVAEEDGEPRVRLHSSAAWPGVAPRELPVGLGEGEGAVTTTAADDAARERLVGVCCGMSASACVMASATTGTSAAGAMSGADTL